MQQTMTIIRHAPTAYNRNSIFMGNLDIPAIPFDEAAITNIRENEQVCKTPLLYTSPLLRAYDTAKAIGNGGKEIVADNRLMERCLGNWQGLPKAEIQALYPHAFINGKMDFYFTPPGGEAYETLVLRAASFITDRCKENDHIVLVTHNGIFRVIKSLLTGQKLSSVFSKSEPHLTPCTFLIAPEVLHTIRENPFYTLDG